MYPPGTFYMKSAVSNSPLKKKTKIQFQIAKQSGTMLKENVIIFQEKLLIKTENPLKLKTSH